MTVKSGMIEKLSEQKGFLSLIGLLVTVAIICFLVYTLLKTYSKNTAPDYRIGDAVATPAGIDTSSYRSIVNSTRGRIDEINRQYETQIDSLGNH